MTDPDLVRRLTTIMDIDVVGFSAMSARDEEHALALLGNRMAVCQALVKHHRGRVFKLTGDGLLAEFASPVEAVRAALEIQEAMRAANDTAGPDDRLQLRVGVNLGDVVESGDDLMGDAVNVAARLESISAPGGVCVSAAVYEQIEGKLTLGVEDMGDQHVKNIPRAIHAYRLSVGGTRPGPAVPSAPAPAAAAPAPSARSSRLAIAAAALAGAAIVALGGGWFLARQGTAPSSAVAPTAPTAAPQQAAPSTTAATSPATAPPVAAPAAPARPAAAEANAVPTVPETTSDSPAPAGLATAPVRRFSAAQVPFVAEWRRGRLEDYARAEGSKALALNVRGWIGMAVRRIDAATARREALEHCNATVAHEVAFPRAFDRCMLYAVGNDVVWSYRDPPMPPPPYLPAAALSPPVTIDPATVPLVREPARRNIADHYLRQTRPRAMVLGHGHFEWWSLSANDGDAIQRNLQICGHIRGRPCVVYAVENRVVVRVPQEHTVTDVFTPEALDNLDPGQKAAVEQYLIANDWRALAVGTNGRLGIVSGRADEATAAKDAVAECASVGGAGCTLTAVGPFLVTRN
ncbi:adenylate/guanylate cyclase domain-containing protein [Reyranella sp.]|uniref:adenylate/guanylate cyclase domain-containing protein n=1 Tax=Reyranella sp. TaxID=1929291 RepID=UPI003BAA4722